MSKPITQSVLEALEPGDNFNVARLDGEFVAMFSTRKGERCAASSPDSAEAATTKMMQRAPGRLREAVYGKYT